VVIDAVPVNVVVDHGAAQTLLSGVALAIEIRVNKDRAADRRQSQARFEALDGKANRVRKADATGS
jgi:hypothetical protein